MMDQAKLADVAYAQVTGSDGSSSLCNSGIATSKVSTSRYALTLPSGTSNGQTLQQPAATDLVLVTPNGTVPVSVSVDNSDSTTKYVYLSTEVDFSVVIMRTLTPPKI